MQQYIIGVDYALGQESRIGGAERPEWRPRVDLRNEEDTTHSFMVDLCEDVDLE